MLQLKTTTFHARISALCQPRNWRKWAGYFVAGSYEHVLDREYWAIRNAAALIDVTPLIKYIIQGKDAAALLHRLTTRDIHKMKVGQVAYTGWCDEDGKLIDDVPEQNPDVSPCEFDQILGGHPEYLTHGQCRKGKVGPPQPQADESDHEREGSDDRNADQDSPPGRKPQLGVENAGRVSTYAEEGGVTE